MATNDKTKHNGNNNSKIATTKTQPAKRTY